MVLKVRHRQRGDHHQLGVHEQWTSSIMGSASIVGCSNVWSSWAVESLSPWVIVQFINNGEFTNTGGSCQRGSFFITRVIRQEPGLWKWNHHHHPSWVIGSSSTIGSSPALEEVVDGGSFYQERKFAKSREFMGSRITILHFMNNWQSISNGEFIKTGRGCQQGGVHQEKKFTEIRELMCSGIIKKWGLHEQWPVH